MNIIGQSAIKFAQFAMKVLLLLSASYPVSSADSATGQVALSPVELKLLAWVDRHEDQMLAELSEHVAINTDTANRAGIDRYRKLLATELQRLGFSTREVGSAPLAVLGCSEASVEFADHLVARRVGTATGRILLSGHMDTVFKADDEFQRLVVGPDGSLRGPGVIDMKGGIVVMLNALRALAAQGLLSDANVTVVLNSDEEMGSLGSRALLESLATEHDLGLVFEGSIDNRLVRSRKGLGQVRLRVTGRESHAGAAHEEGVSANLELAHKVIAIESLTDYSKKLTVNVGVMSGGEKRNTIPGCAEAYIDLRFPSAQAGKALVEKIEAIVSTPSSTYAGYPGLPSTELWVSLHRPVKPVNARVDELLAEAIGLSQLIGEPIEGTYYSGGGTDGSITQAVGLPTLDTLGLDGEGAHSSRETTSVKSLLARTKLAAVLIGRSLDKGVSALEHK